MSSPKWALLPALLIAFGMIQLNCVANQTTFVVEGNALVTGCQPEASLSLQRVVGTLDLTMSTQYTFFPVVTNRLPNTLGPVGNVITDIPANDIILSGYKVEYRVPNLSSTYERKLQFAVNGQVKAGETVGLLIPLVPRQVIDELRADPLFNNPNLSPAQTRQIQVEMSVKYSFFGRTRSGFTVTTEAQTYPIIICRGCLASALELGVGESCAGTEPPTLSTEACQIGQDELIDCRLCRKLAVSVADREYCDADIVPTN